MLLLALLRELQRVWKLDGDLFCEAATVANAARLLGETLDGVETEGDLNTVWEDPHGVRCPPPPPSMRPSAAEVSAQCPMLTTLATLLLKNEVFEALPWKAPGHSAQMAEGFSKAMGRELKLKSAMLIGDPGFGALIESNRYFVGVMHLAPDAYYPPHCHDAEEFYHVIGGRANVLFTN